MEGGRGDQKQKAFLSAHRCPEADRLPQQNPAKSPEPTCPGEAGYLDILSKEEEEDNNEDLSDWSEEDLSLHFSPSVILQSDDEEQEQGNRLGCVDVTVDSQVKSQRGEGLKMVPKRQIQLKKKEEDMAEQVTQNNPSTPSERVDSGYQRQDLLLRQHSMPIFQAGSRAETEVDSYRVYKGLISGASQGPPPGGSVRRLQKSLSLDETKTMMASCIIKNVLTKKMQVEQGGTATTKDLKMKAQVPPAPPPVEVGGCRAPIHVVRDVRSLVKHTYDTTFSRATPKPVDKKPTRFKMILPKESPPPTYQQAVGVKGHIAAIAALGSKLQTKKDADFSRRPIRESNISRTKGGDVMRMGRPSEASENNQSEKAATPPSDSVFLQSPPARDTQVFSAQESNPARVVSSETTQGYPQHVLHPCFYASPHPHLGRVSFVHGPLSYMQAHPAPLASTIHMSRRSEDNQDRSTEPSSSQVGWTRTAADLGGRTVGVKPAAPEQQQKPFVCSVQGFAPAQVSADLIGPAATPTAFLGLPSSCHLMYDPKTGRGFYVDTPPPPQRKILLDPETGQFFQVFLPAASPAPTMLHVGGANPAVLSVMPFPPLMVPSLYGSPCLPITMTTPAAPQ